jgi:hypothetical protein
LRRHGDERGVYLMLAALFVFVCLGLTARSIDRRTHLLVAVTATVMTALYYFRGSLM